MSDEAWDVEEEAVVTAALRSYAVTSPRQGLEARMLAHVDTASKPQVRFVWLLAPALALLAMVSVLVPYGRRSPHPQPMRVQTASMPSSVQQAQRPARTRIVKTRLQLQRPSTAASERKPFHVMPLSHQERLLLQFASSPEQPSSILDAPDPVPITPLQISALRIEPLAASTNNR